MVVCPECGQEVQNSQPSCPKCGWKQGLRPQPSTAQGEQSGSHDSAGGLDRTTRSVLIGVAVLIVVLLSLFFVWRGIVYMDCIKECQAYNPGASRATCESFPCHFLPR